MGTALVVDFSLFYHLTVIETDEEIAEFLYLRGAVGNQDETHAILTQLRNPCMALFLECLVTHGQNLIGQEDVRLEMDGYREAQTHLHAGRVVFQRRVDEVAKFGKVNDLWYSGADLAVGEAVEAGIQKDVFITTQLGMKAHAKLNQGGYPAVGANLSAAGLQYAGNDLEQGTFAGAVVTEQAQRLSLLQGKTHIAQGLETFPSFPLAGMEDAEKTGFEPHGAVVAQDEFLA